MIWYRWLQFQLHNFRLHFFLEVNLDRPTTQLQNWIAILKTIGEKEFDNKMQYILRVVLTKSIIFLLNNGLPFLDTPVSL